LFIIGSKFADAFSLSSEEYAAEKASLLNAGVVGVRGMSSDTSEAVVVELVGVFSTEADERLGVTGRGSNSAMGKRLPSR
jgi:hypothetical protein